MKKKIKNLIAMFLAVIMAFTALPAGLAVFAEEGATYYVSPSGDDANPGTIDAPKKTVSSFTSSLQPGDQVIFREGTYNDVIVFNGSGGSSNGDPIVFKSYEGEKVILTSDNSAYIMFFGHCQNIYVDGLTFSGKNGEIRGHAINIVNFDKDSQQTSDIKITNCKFIDCSAGIIMRDVIETGDTDKKFGNMEISNNIFMASNPSNKVGMGIDLQEARAQDGKYIQIFNNVIINATYSLYLFGRSENVLFYNNTMLDTYDSENGLGQFDIYPVQGAYNKNIYSPDISYNCVFKNNIFTKPIRTQLEANATLFDADKHNVFENNVYASNSLTEYVTYNYGGTGPTLTFSGLQAYGDMGHEANGIYEPVDFVDADSDGRLSGSSNPAVTAATDTITDTVSAPATDILGKTRTREAGAYAFDNTLVFVGANSGTADGTYSKPYATITDAIAVNANNIQVKNGTYAEGGLSVPAGVTITPYSKNSSVIIEGAVSFAGGSSSTSVSELTFQGAVFAGNNVELNGCQFNSDVTLNSADAASVTSSRFSASLILTGAENSKIVNNIFDSIADTAVSVDGNSTGNVLYNNTFINSNADIDIQAGSDNNLIKNNIFSSPNINDGSGNIFDYNCYNTNEEEGTYTAESVIPDTNGIKADPAFINSIDHDYRLFKNSPCIGKGITDSFTPAKDINGIARSNPSDIGAYTYVKVENTYYVSVTGNDTNAGTSESPFATIGAAIKAIRTGESVIISSGTYTEDVVISGKTGSAADSYIIKAADDADVMINGTVTVSGSTGVTLEEIHVTAASDETAVTVSGSSETTLTDITVAGQTGLSISDGSDVDANILNATDVPNGITLDESSLNVTRAKIKNASVAAIAADNASSLTLTSSVILNGTAGVIAAGESAITIVNNTFYNISGLSIDVTQQDGSATALDIYNNIYSRSIRNQGIFVSINKASGFNSENNIYDADDITKIASVKEDERTLEELQAGGDDTRSIIGDPRFQNTASENFAPAEGSPAARAGYSHSAVPVEDLLGKPFASIMDIGAYYSPYTLKVYHVVPYGIGWGWYDPDSTHDTAGPPDGSYDRPFTSLSDALAVASSSDTIMVHKGVYTGRQDIVNLSGAEGAPITIVGCTDPDDWYNQQYDSKAFYLCPPDAPDLDQPVFTSANMGYHFASTETASEEDVGMKLTDCSYITIKDIDFAGFSGAGIWIYGGDNIIFDNLHLYNIDNTANINSGVEGALINDATNCTFRNLLIWDIGYTRKSHADHGIYVGHCDNNVFENNVIIGAPGAGIQFYSGDNYNIHSTNITVQNNVFSQCRFGLIMCGISDFNIVNNTFHNSLEDDLYFDWNTTENTIQNNLFYNDIEVGSIETVPTVIARHNGSGVNRVSGNLFTNNIYEYQYYEPLCQEGWSEEKVSIEDFINTQNSNSLNTFTEFNAGNVEFINSDVDGSLSNAEQALQISEDLFRISANSDCVDTGLAANAPAADRDDKARVGNPDLGAYEAPVVNQDQEPEQDEEEEQNLPVPVTKGDTTTYTIEPENYGSDTANKVIVSKADVSRAIRESLSAAQISGTKARVEIRVNSNEQAEQVQISVPVTSLKKIAKSDVPDLLLSSGLATIAFSRDALNGLASQAFDSSLRISAEKADISILPEQVRAEIGDAVVYEFTIMDGTKVINDFGGGKATVTIPYTLKSGETADGIVVWYIGSDGTLQKMEGVKYDSTAKTGTFETTHFSTYAVSYNPAAASEAATETPNDNTGSDVEKIPDTGNHTASMMILPVMLILGAGLAIFQKNRKTRN